VRRPGLGVAVPAVMMTFLPVLLSLSTSLSSSAPSSGPSSVVGGKPAKPGDWPDAVAVIAPRAVCTGTLITPDVVLTAGHCIDTGPVVVVVDTTDYGAPGGEAIRVKWSMAYPSWQTSYDVGVVVLAHAAKAKPRLVAAACTVRAGLIAGAPVELVGFGLTTKAGTGDNSLLHQAQIPVVDPACTDARGCNPAIAPGGEFVAGGNDKDACYGDSGGPIYLDTPGGKALVGVVSRASTTEGQPCGGGGIYVRADKVVSWIQRVTHETVARTHCAGAADEADATDDAGDALEAGAQGGCAAGGGAGGNLVIALGVLATARLARRRARSAQNA